MKRIIIQDETTINISNINTVIYYILIKNDEGILLNYNSSKDLVRVVGGEIYEEITFEELIEGGAEAYQFYTEREAIDWIKENL